jgi:hypothetical protein
MANGLADLGAPVEDWIVVLNILRGLNQRFEYVGSIIRCYSPFSNFLKVRDDLLLEEIHIDNIETPAAPMMLYINVASPAVKPPSFTLSHPSNDSNGGTGGNRTKYNNKNCKNGNDSGHNGKNSTDGGGRGESSLQTIASTGFDGRTNAPWSTYDHPW